MAGLLFMYPEHMAGKLSIVLGFSFWAEVR